ncbi:hypothetical protein C4544_00205 [candidate division WS5 bacterium]|uniref:Type IV secretion system protein n=1 Tax=candidate division WS5 bacterium TaxID=2093353 RepID=A0A419DGN9_9BACT|nr:MAG: hypothetical protein C4544_00205 [candidate division WS5 bacterium]
MRLSKIFNSFKDKQIILSIFLTFFIASFFFAPTLSLAYDFGIGDSIRDAVTTALLGAAQGAFKGGIWAVNAAISFMSNFINGQRLSAWNTVRTSALGLFGLVILTIAFMNLLRIQIQVWGANRMIPKLFLAIFLVIFSKFICISIINFSTALANTFMYGIAFQNFNNLLDPNGGMKIFDPDSNVSIVSAFAVLIFSGLAFLVLLILAAILFFRAVVLALLIVISPLAFSLTVLPWTQKYFQEWWQHFLKWTFFFPICILILSIGFSLIPGQGNPPEPYTAGAPVDPNKTYYCINAPGTEATPPGCIPAYPSGEETNEQKEATTSFFGMLTGLFVALAAVILSVYLPLKMLGAFGAAAQGFLKKNATDIPGLKTGRRAYLNPSTYKRMWDHRKAAKDTAIQQDIGQKMFNWSNRITGKDGKRTGLSKFATGMDDDARADYVKKNVDRAVRDIGNPKALAHFFNYQAAAAMYGENSDTARNALKKFQDLATDDEQRSADSLVKALGGNKQALGVLTKAFAERGSGERDFFHNDHTVKAMQDAGVMKGNIVVAKELRKQVPSMAAGLAPHQLSAEGFKDAKAWSWQDYSDDDLMGVSDGIAHTWFERSGGSQEQFDKAIEAFERAGNDSVANILRGNVPVGGEGGRGANE